MTLSSEPGAEPKVERTYPKLKLELRLLSNVYGRKR